MNNGYIYGTLIITMINFIFVVLSVIIESTFLFANSITNFLFTGMLISYFNDYWQCEKCGQKNGEITK